MHKVSVIIPTYNCARYITEAIESVLSQAFQDYEIIVIDDGSADDTREILRPYIESGKISYFYQKNKGPAVARNRGLIEARGDYIAFLDADDVWYSHKLSCQIEYLETHPQVGLICSNTDRFNEKGILSGTKLGNMRIKNPITLDQLLLKNFVQTLTVVVRKDCIGSVGYFNESKDSQFVEDYELWLRILMKYPIYYMHNSLAKYRFRPGNDSSNIKSVRLAVLNLTKKICTEYPEIKIRYKNIIKKASAARFYEMGYDCFSRNELLESRKYLITAIGLNHFNIKTWIYLLSSLMPLTCLKIIKNLKSKI